MKFSLINVNTFFVVIIILVCTSFLSYNSIFDGLFFSDLILVAKFFLVIIILINIFTIGFVIYKFRVIIIYSNQMLIVYPLRFLTIKSSIDKLKGLKWGNYIDTKAIYYRKLTFKTENNKTITFCDKEFENLDFLAKSLRFDLENKNLKRLTIERAKANKSNQFSNVLVATFLTCSMIYAAVNMETWNDVKIIFFSIISIIVIPFLIFNIKKYFMYNKNIS